MDVTKVNQNPESYQTEASCHHCGKILLTSTTESTVEQDFVGDTQIIVHYSVEKETLHGDWVEVYNENSKVRLPFCECKGHGCFYNDESELVKEVDFNGGLGLQQYAVSIFRGQTEVIVSTTIQRIEVPKTKMLSIPKPSEEI